MVVLSTSSWEIIAYFYNIPCTNVVRINDNTKAKASRATASKFRRIMSAVGTILFIAQGAMRAKPEMKPWVHTDKSRMSSFRSGTNRASIRLRKVPPLWGSINIPITINPGLAPWAMQVYRPYRAHLRFHHQSIPLLF